MLLFRKLVQAGLTIETGSKTFGIGDGSLILTFVVSELTDPNNIKAQSVFTEFLCDIETMKEYGMPYYIDLSTGESGTRISYTLRWSVLGSFRNSIEQMQEHEKNKNSLTDFEIDLFEKSFAHDLAQYELDLKEEIRIAHGKQ